MSSTGTKSTEIQFLFDFISPYAYLASTRIREIAARYDRNVVPVPVLFARLLDAAGTRGPAEIPVKRAYLYRDILRLARMLGVPIEPPASHPFNPLLALRVTASVDDVAARFRLVDALYKATWAESRRVDEPEIVARIATEQGLDGAALLERAKAEDVKATLRRDTENAVAKGVFGVPTMIVDGEMFWGVDSLPLLERFLGGERATDDESLDRWNRVAPSAVRRAGG